MRRYEIGEKYELEIVGIGREFVYLDCKDKTEGVVKIEEVLGDDGRPLVKEGEKIEVYFVGLDSGLKVFTTVGDLYSTIDLKRVKELYELGLPVEGEVTREIKGGFEVRIGRIRCFCPFSHMPKSEGRDDQILGKTLSFKILSIESEGKNILLSRRLFLEEERKKRKDMLFSSLKPGDTVEAEVKQIGPKGVVMDLSGFKAFLPIGELSWDYVKEPEEYLKVGQRIKAVVKELEEETEKIVLTLKDPAKDPLRDFLERISPGSELSGTVKRIENFGLILELGNGLRGILRRENLGLRIRVSDLRQIFKIDQVLRVQLVDVDLERRRIELKLSEPYQLEGFSFPKPGEILDSKVLKMAERGLLVEVEGGFIGYVPQSELLKKIEKGKSKNYEPGSNLKLLVIEADAEKGKLVLSERKVEEKEEEDEYERYRRSVEEKSTSFFGLKEILEKSLKET